MKHLVILSMSVYPENVAMGLLVHHLANTLSNEIQVTVIGEEPSFKSPWDGTPKYKIVSLDTTVIPYKKGKRYHSWLSFRRNKNLISKFCLDKKVTHILACFPNEYHMMLAQSVAVKHNIPFYPWFHNTYLENRRGVFKALSKYFQPKIFSSARKIYAISEGLAQYYSETYPSYEFDVILHGFPKYTATKTLPIQDDIIRLAMTGTLNASCLDAAVRLAKVITEATNLELHIFGKRNAEVLAQHHIDINKAVIHGFLPEKEFNERLADCDIMLLPHGLDGSRSDVEYQTIFPTRTIPLLSTFRPILAHTPANVFFTDFIRKYDFAAIVDTKDEAAILKKIDQLSTDKNLVNHLIENAISVNQMFTVDAVASKLLADL